MLLQWVSGNFIECFCQTCENWLYFVC